MHTRLVRRYTADATHFPFLPCTPGPECIARQASFRSAFDGHRFFEVWHFAFKSKREPSGPHALRWAHVLDGESLWYWHAPGSGVFYDGGVVCSAPGKIHMLALLLRRWLESPSPVPSVAKSVGAALARLAAKMGEQGRGVEGVLTRVNASAHGERGCASAKLESCMYDWFLMDRWDRLLGELGRALGYDTLFFTASTWGVQQAVPFGELVDLRVQAAAARMAKRHDRAKALLELARSRLSLRDPFQQRGSRREHARKTTLPCNFTQEHPTLRLACPGHASWAVRDEPRYERNCRRVGTAARAHDSAFMT